MAKEQLSNNELAEAFVRNEKYVSDLVYHEEYRSFFIYKNGRYKILPLNVFKKEVYNFIRVNFPKQNIRQDMVKDVMFQIEMLCYRVEEREVDHIISFNDVFYNTKKFETEKKSKDVFTIFHVPYSFEQTKKPIVAFKKFLCSSIVYYNKEDGKYYPDEELQNLVQEMLGYFLLGGLEGYRAWFLIGEGGNGKGVLSRVIEKIIGQEYVQSMTIQALTTNNYNAAELIGKKINISNEDESKYIESQTFKAMVAGDRIHTMVKFKDGFNFCPRTKFLFCSNRKPTFKDLDYGVERRLMFIPFYRIFMDGDEDKDNKIEEKLEKEIPQIIGWALEGAKRLVENKFKYTKSLASAEMFKAFQEEILSGYEFFNENYINDDSSVVSKKELYSEYREYCYNTGKKPFSYNNFRNQIKTHVRGLKEKKTRIKDNYEGYKYIDGYAIIKKQEYEQIKNVFD